MKKLLLLVATLALLAACAGASAGDQYRSLATAVNTAQEKANEALNDPAVTVESARSALQGFATALRAFDDGLRSLSVPESAKADVAALLRADAAADVELRSAAAATTLDDIFSHMTAFWQVQGQGSALANTVRGDLGIEGVPILGASSPKSSPSSSAAAAETAEAAPTPIVATPFPSPVVLTGDTNLNTAPFTLPAGDYRSDWQKESGCTLGAYLKPTDTTSYGGWDLGGSNFDGPTSGTTYAYGVPAGQYYARVQGSCHWTVTLTRQ